MIASRCVVEAALTVGGDRCVPRGTDVRGVIDA